MKQIALITGATSGIGEATAHKLASLGYNLIITGRRQNKLIALQATLENLFPINVIALDYDIRKWEDNKKVIEQLEKEWQSIDVLINNAGLAAGADPVQEGLLEDWEQMIDTNIKGLLYITKLIVPGMIERKRGHIINISSIAGKEVYANGNVYCASKHAVDALTKGMRIDLLQHNIKVGSIAPGMVETEFSVVRFHGDQDKADNVYKGLIPLNANDIADTVEFMLTRPPHVNINDILIMPSAQASAVYNHRN